MSIDCHVLLAMACADANGDLQRAIRVTDHDGPSALDPLIDHCACNGWLTRYRDRVRLTEAGRNLVRGWAHDRVAGNRGLAENKAR